MSARIYKTNTSNIFVHSDDYIVIQQIMAAGGRTKPIAGVFFEI